MAPPSNQHHKIRTCDLGAIAPAMTVTRGRDSHIQRSVSREFALLSDDLTT
jgi:hypothetical protein